MSEIRNRTEAPEKFVLGNKLPTAESGAKKRIVKAVIEMKIYVKTFVGEPPVRASGFRTLVN